ncbi:hypothetical protein EVC37_02995 [Methylocaldum sp. BRCS4]|jgi:hypothetical protein|nr:hypothetical protein [Methylocaldum sp. BRCS4]
MAKPTNFDTELARLRTEIAATKERIEWLRDAPQAYEEACKQASDAVRAQARHADLSVGRFCRPGYMGSDLLRSSGDLTQIMCRLFPEAMEHRLHALIAEHYETVEAGPPLAERAGRKLELEQVLFDLELAEERLICDWEREHGQVFPRRRDINAAVVLGSFEEVA